MDIFREENLIKNTIKNEDSSFDENLERKKQRQDIELKNKIYKFTTRLLIGELILLLVLFILRGFSWFNFYIDDKVIMVFSSGCVVQTLLTVRYIVLHLFPDFSKNKG